MSVSLTCLVVTHFVVRANTLFGASTGDPSSSSTLGDGSSTTWSDTILSSRDVSTIQLGARVAFRFVSRDINGTLYQVLFQIWSSSGFMLSMAGMEPLSTRCFSVSRQLRGVDKQVWVSHFNKVPRDPQDPLPQLGFGDVISTLSFTIYTMTVFPSRVPSGGPWHMRLTTDSELYLFSLTVFNALVLSRGDSVLDVSRDFLAGTSSQSTSSPHVG